MVKIDLTKEDLQIIKDELITKPIGSFKDFDSCVSEQKKKGHDDDSAKRICELLQAKTEGKGKDKKKT